MTIEPWQHLRRREGRVLRRRRALATSPADMFHRAGGGIIAYPGGTAATAGSMTQARQAAPAGAPSDTHAETRDEQRQAMTTFVETR